MTTDAVRTIATHGTCFLCDGAGSLGPSKCPDCEGSGIGCGCANCMGDPDATAEPPEDSHV